MRGLAVFIAVSLGAATLVELSSAAEAPSTLRSSQAEKPASGRAQRDGRDWWTMIGSGCFAAAFAAGVVLSVLGRRPLAVYNGVELPVHSRHHRRRRRRRKGRRLPLR